MAAKAVVKVAAMAAAAAEVEAAAVAETNCLSPEACFGGDRPFYAPRWMLRP